MSIIIINGVDLPAPSKIKIRDGSIDNIEVNELGVEQRDNVRTNIKYVDLEFEELNNSELQLIMGAVESLVLNVDFPSSSGLIQRKMRLNSDLDMELVPTRNGRAYWNVSFNLKEY